ncbi:signal recognition particle-docking protein FtsY [Trinickia dinghuensis]|uniref:Signal recognition particle receptor FtsY n=1 Tax=Trinickia dinghuensis TaxID=2291023 RepID=A0A3D8K554_9BURK|nr:signal recognition particle-docking protein FtsY [Trinickia dinghuensis]RDV00163.1 signal recognition particle-docking protein FtsY [Trinickia dinghuensis]
MFSFFKRFKGGKTSDTPQETPDAQEPTQAEPEASPAPAAAQRAQSSPNVPSASAPSTVSSTPAASSAPFTAPPPAAPAAAQPGAAPSAVATAPALADEFETEEIVPPPAPEPAQKQSWMARLRSGLSKTSAGLTGIFVRTKIDEDLYEELETALLMSDAGVEATDFLLGALREKVRTQRLTDPQQVKTALRTLIVELLQPLEKSLMLGRAQPLVMMIAGVNGAGKTTSIGKLAKHLQRFEQSVLLAAGDTFRAAAREQLAIWGERNNVTVVSQESGDPAAVIFDAVSAARARKIDVVMADTAGRLPTQLHLMEELRKVKRVIGKAYDGAPHEVLLVIDANTGQNALAQVKAFDDALSLTGLIVTKLDGTAKGGILAAIARQRPVPVYFIGVGEKVEDLQPFDAEEFADALLG